VRRDLRIGIIGAGWSGRQHARAIGANQDALLATLADPNEAPVAEFNRTYTPDKCYPDCADLLDKADAAFAAKRATICPV
jgi:predicted dehydrogenase